MQGTDLRDVVNLHDGFDVYEALGGDDIIFKYSGLAWVDGGSGHDWFSFYYSPHGVHIDLSKSNSHATYLNTTGLYVEMVSFEEFSGSTKDDRFTGSAGDDIFHGFQGNDIIKGGTGADTLNGGDGSDVIRGGEGRDIMSGGDGADEFVFSSKDTGDFDHEEADIILDFDSSDTIVIEESLTDVGDSYSVGQGEYSVTAFDGGYLITWMDDLYRIKNVQVFGDDPTGQIEVDVLI